jgi:hypothetical protein
VYVCVVNAVTHVDCLQDNTRTNPLKVVASINKLAIEYVDLPKIGAGVSADYIKYNSLGKIPTFVGSDGYVLTECIAIAIYRMLTLCRSTVYDEPFSVIPV